MTIQEARYFVGQQMGIAPFDGSRAAYANLSQQQQIELTSLLVKFIQQNPGSFTDQQNATASTINADGLVYQNSAVSANDVMDALGGSFLSTIGNPLASIGQGVSSATSLLGKLIPWLIVGAIVVLSAPYVIRAFKK